MDKNTLTTYHKTYQRELFESVIPFWLNHSLDHEDGGYFTLLERDGTVFDTDKYAWMQAREIWAFSKLCSVYGIREEWLHAATHGLRFMRRHGRADGGDCYFAIDKTGRPLIHPYNIFADCFLCIALSEYAKVTGEQAAADEALALYRRIQERTANPKGVWNKAVPGGRHFLAMSMPMIQMMMARDLKGMVADTELEPVIQRSLEQFFDLHVDRERQCIFERVLPDGNRKLDVMEGRLLNPGHALECMWFMMDIAQERGWRDVVNELAALMLWPAQRGWDEEHGGLFYYQDYLGYPTDKLESHMKLWWVHAEALCAFLLAYKLTGSQEHLQWFQRLHDYSFAHFSDPQHGEWYGYLHQNGTPAFGLKGGKWKGFFHLPRALMHCEVWLREMLEAATTAAGRDGLTC